MLASAIMALKNVLPQAELYDLRQQVISCAAMHTHLKPCPSSISKLNVFRSGIKELNVNKNNAKVYTVLYSDLHLYLVKKSHDFGLLWR